MQIKVRRGVFETNSSSTHCLSVIEPKRVDKEYFDFKWSVQDGYLRLRFPRDLSWDTPFETFESKLSYLTILRIGHKHGMYCGEGGDEMVRPVEFEKSGELDEWFGLVLARLKEMGIDLKGIDLGYNYVNDAVGKKHWEYGDDDYDEDPPIITKDTTITDKLKHMHLKWDIDHQVIDCKPDNTVGGSILVKTMYKDPYDEDQKEPEMMLVEFDTDKTMSDIDILFNPHLSIVYTWDNGGIRDFEKKINVEKQIKETK